MRFISIWSYSINALSDIKIIFLSLSYFFYWIWHCKRTSLVLQHLDRNDLAIINSYCYFIAINIQKKTKNNKQTIFWSHGGFIKSLNSLTLLYYKVPFHVDKKSRLVMDILNMTSDNLNSYNVLYSIFYKG